MRKRLFGIRKLNNKKGFTFVEVIVAIALLAIIGTLAFSMFSNATRYMSKAKKEEYKQSQAQSMLQVETFKYSSATNEAVNGLHIIYVSDMLVTNYVVVNEITSEKSPMYSLSMTYTTDYGNVTLLVPLTRTGEKIYKNSFPYYKYEVSSDVGTKRYLYVYEDHYYYPVDIEDNLADN